MYHLTAKKSILAELKCTLLEQLAAARRSAANQNNKCRVYILSKSGYSCKPLLASTASRANKLGKNEDELNFFMSTVSTVLTLKPVLKFFKTFFQ